MGRGAEPVTRRRVRQALQHEADEGVGGAKACGRDAELAAEGVGEVALVREAGVPTGQGNAGRATFAAMKLAELRSIDHNVADSLADGNGLLVGLYAMNVFGEAAQSADGFIEVDLLTGSTSGGKPSASLTRAFELYAKALPSFCEKHCVSSSAFRVLSARFTGRGLLRGFVVTVEDQDGRRAVDEYEGVPGRRVRVLDPLGRIRKKPTMR